MTGNRLWLGAHRGGGRGPLEHQLLSTTPPPHPQPSTCRPAWCLETPPLARQGRRDLDERPDPWPGPGNTVLVVMVGGWVWRSRGTRLEVGARSSGSLL